MFSSFTEEHHSAIDSPPVDLARRSCFSGDEPGARNQTDQTVLTLEVLVVHLELESWLSVGFWEASGTDPYFLVDLPISASEVLNILNMPQIKEVCDASSKVCCRVHTETFRSGVVNWLSGFVAVLKLHAELCWNRVHVGSNC